MTTDSDGPYIPELNREVCNFTHKNTPFTVTAGMNEDPDTGGGTYFHMMIFVGDEFLNPWKLLFDSDTTGPDDVSPRNEAFYDAYVNNTLVLNGNWTDTGRHWIKCIAELYVDAVSKGVHEHYWENFEKRTQAVA